MGNRRRVVAVVVAVVVLATLVVAGRQLWRERHRSDLSRALDVVPAGTERLTFTDWSGVRTALRANLSASSDPAAIQSLVDRAYDADLSAAAVTGRSAVDLQKFFGFSAATIDWEAYGQGPKGAALVLRMPDSFDLGTVEDHLAKLGFTRPKISTGVWLGGTDLVAALNPDDPITPELQYVAVLADRGLVVASDSAEYADEAAASALGKVKSLGDVAGVRAVVKPVSDPVAATVWAGDFACTDLAMSEADQDAQDQAATLVARAGKVSPLSGLVMAMAGDRTLTVSELFESSDSAKTNLASRAKLAVGEAPGRFSSFSDDLTLTSSQTKGATVQLTFKPKEKTGAVLSLVDSGPVLFATC